MWVDRVATAAKGPMRDSLAGSGTIERAVGRLTLSLKWAQRLRWKLGLSIVLVVLFVIVAARVVQVDILHG